MHPLHSTAASFLYQHAELWLYTHGRATRWLGGMEPKKADPDSIVGIAFGKPTEPAVRGAYEFRHKPLDEMSKEADLRLEVARLASSGMNGQPWHYIVDGSKIHIYYKPSPRGILGKVYSLTGLAVGISLCRLAVADEYEGRPFRFIVYRDGIPAPPNGFVYVGTVE